jgi:biotin operon repressor
MRKGNARWMKVLGLVVLMAGAFAAMAPLAEMFVGGRLTGGQIWELMTYFAMAAGGFALFSGGIKMDSDLRRFARYLAVLGDREFIPLAELGKKLGWSVRRVSKDLEKMLDRGYFGGQAYMDQGQGLFFRTAQAEYKFREQQRQAQSPPSPKEAESGYSGILRNIRRANDRIADPILSEKIDRLEAITARIFRAVEDDPQKRIRIDTFLNYYLPTTQKLLDAYADFDAAGVEGENLRQAKKRIEQTMDNIVAGFAHQLDQLYKTDALDVDSDIRVMETMLHRDTASAERDFGLGIGAQEEGS